MVTYTFTNGTVADATEVNQNFQDVSYRLISSDTNEVSGNQIITISVPAGEVTEMIEIKSRIYGRASMGSDNTNYSGQFKIYKTYSGTDTDLIPNHTIVGRNYSASSGYGSDTDTNEVFTNYIYEPTSDEKTNGFDVTIEMSSINTTMTHYYTFIMGR